jgi:hypothetical protein
VIYTDATCHSSTVRACGAPYICVPGQSACVSPEPAFNSDGTHSGHLQAQPQLVSPGLTTTLYWDVSNVESCTVTGSNGDSWSGLSGIKTSAPILTQTLYTLSCVPLTGDPFTEQQSVSVVPIFQEL